jgi:transposase
VFALTTSYRFLLYRKVTDMRKGFDGPCGLVKNELNPRTNQWRSVYLHQQVTRSHKTIALKRLEKGTIGLPALKADSISCQLNYADLVLLIEGISVEKVVQRVRY